MQNPPPPDLRKIGLLRPATAIDTPADDSPSPSDRWDVARLYAALYAIKDYEQHGDTESASSVRKRMVAQAGFQQLLTIYIAECGQFTSDTFLQPLAQCARRNGMTLAETGVLGIPDLVRLFDGVLSPTPPTVKPEQSEGNGGADAAQGSVVKSGADRAAILKRLQSADRKAYLAYQYAETMAEKRLQDRKAYDWLKENEIDADKGDVGELADYELPTFDTWAKQLRNARNPLGEQKYTRRAGRAGRSIVSGEEIEYRGQNSD